MRQMDDASKELNLGRSESSGEMESLHRNASPPPETDESADESIRVLDVCFFTLDEERGNEKSWKPEGVTSDSCAGVTVARLWKVSVKANISESCDLITSSMKIGRVSLKNDPMLTERMIAEGVDGPGWDEYLHIRLRG